MKKIDPFDLPEEYDAKANPDSRKLTMGQLNEAIDSLVTKVAGQPNKTWGHTKSDIEYWLRMIVDETEKILAKNNG